MYDIENLNSISCIHDNERNEIVEWNLLHDILNPSELTKKLNSHYSPILHGCMNTWKGRENLRTLESYWIVDVVPR